MGGQKWKEAWHEITNLTFRRFQTRYHREAWVHFDKVMRHRTILFLVAKNLIFIIATVLGDDVYHMSRNYLDKGGP